MKLNEFDDGYYTYQTKMTIMLYKIIVYFSFLN